MTSLLGAVVKHVKEINVATLSGAIDIIVIEQPDGSYRCTPFHVRFGKLKLLKSREKIVTISVNGKQTDLFMKLGAAGEAYFVEECEDPPLRELSPSPILIEPPTHDFKPIEAFDLASGDMKTSSSASLDAPERSLSDPIPLSSSMESASESIRAHAAHRHHVQPNINVIPPVSTSAGLGLSDDEGPGRDVSGRDVSPSRPQTAIPLTPPDSPPGGRGSWAWPWGSLPVRRNLDGQLNRSHTDSLLAMHAQTADHGGALSDHSVSDSEDEDPLASLPLGPENSQLDTLDSFSLASSIGSSSAQVPTSTSPPTGPQVPRPSVLPGNLVPDVNSLLCTVPPVSGPGPAPPRLILSLCGKLLPPPVLLGGSITGFPDLEAAFEKHIVTPEQLASNPLLLRNEHLVGRVGNRVYPWSMLGGSLVFSLCFGTAPPQEMLDKLLPPLPKAQEPKVGWAGWLWGGGKKPPPAAAQIISTKADGTPSTPPRPGKESSGPPSDGATSPTLQGVQATDSDGDRPGPSGDFGSPKRTYLRKSLRPSSAQLASLGLQEGVNSITFRVQSQLQGTAEVSSCIYLWPWTVNLVVSDVDGTITKSDVLGHIFPIVGKDWSHPGITSLFSAVNGNGYQLLYLTSRAIGQANTTRWYLNGLRQGRAALPIGPVIMSPDRLVTSLTREVIYRRPHEFKIAALKDIWGLFPDDQSHNPFYAGFGNRHTDVVSYRAVGIPEGKIFLINASTEIRNFNRTYVKSYRALHEMYNEMFPPVKPREPRDPENFNDFNYWRPALPPLEDEPPPPSKPAPVSKSPTITTTTAKPTTSTSKPAK